MSFDYLLEKISSGKFTDTPFPHIHINDFFEDRHFSQIISSPEIKISDLDSDRALFDALFDGGYKIIDFPGCITDRHEYIQWHKNKRAGRIKNNSSCEGAGITLRLMNPHSSIISELTSFLSGREFIETLAAKFEIRLAEVCFDGGLHKYLDGYEISPHPDVRRKAVTYMVNVNPDIHAEENDHHTQYLEFESAYKYVQTYWEAHADADRCWVPWDWCKTKKIQRTNNSIILFSPANNTMHGVKSRYNHLVNQRTQLYGNLWYNEKTVTRIPMWEDFVIRETNRAPVPSRASKIGDSIAAPFRHLVKSIGARRNDAVDSQVLLDRFKKK
ncbi:MAG: hypothetical protein QFE16_00415 [Pseudomonadota bacterium]|nr:hypothetical protein [Pseudomonadota bacterium]